MTRTIVESKTRTAIIGFDQPFCVIGERINPTGRKKLAAELEAGDFSTVEKDAIAFQFIAFLVVTGGMLLAVRPIARNYLKTNVINTNVDRLIGKVAVCTKMINVGERGEVKIDGKYWMAVTTSEDDIDIDEKVEVLAVEGVKLVVDRIK